MAKIEQMRSKLKTAKMRLVTARKIKEVARVDEPIAITKIKTFIRIGRRGNGEEMLHEKILKIIEKTAREITSSRRTLKEGLEKVNTKKMKAEYKL